MKLMLLTMLLSTIVFADITSDWQKQKAAAVKVVNSIKPYQCFAELSMYSSDHSWEIPVTKYGLPYVLIMQDSKGVLFLQPHPYKCEDESKPCYHYWTRSYEKSELPFFNISVVPCPKHLNRKTVLQHVLNQHLDTINTKVFP